MPSTRTGDTTVKHGLVFPSVADLADPELLVEFAVAADESGWDGVVAIEGIPTNEMWNLAIESRLKHR